MDAELETSLREQLLDRRRRVQAVVADLGPEGDLVRLLQDIDAALQRVGTPAFGLCDVCHTAVDDPDLIAHPTTTYCLCSLDSEQQAALQDDLDLAARVQWSLLPRQDLSFAGWDLHFRYDPAGPVSGDYCDVVLREAEQELFAFLGDVSGKGVAASLLMARLSALFRSLADGGLPLTEILSRGSRLFGEVKPSTHYATLAALRASATGEVEIGNAGHCRPLLLRGGEVVAIETTGFPIGLVRTAAYRTHRVGLDPGDTLFLYSDGLTEAFNRADEPYGSERLHRVLRDAAKLPPRRLASACLEDLRAFLDGHGRGDDLTLLVLRRTG